MNFLPFTDSIKRLLLEIKTKVFQKYKQEKSHRDISVLFLAESCKFAECSWGEAVISFVQQQHAGISFTSCLAKGNYDTGLLASKVLMSRLQISYYYFPQRLHFPKQLKGGEKGQLQGKPAGTRIGQGRKMPHADLISIFQMLHAFIGLSIVFFPNITPNFCQLRVKMAIYCPQGSGTLCQQLLMMH